MRTVLRQDLTAAIKARDRVAMTALRSALSAIDNAEAVPLVDQPQTTVGAEHIAGAVVGGGDEAAPQDLSESDLRLIVETEIEQRSAEALEYEQLGRTDLAQRLRAEADVLHRYLPTESR